MYICAAAQNYSESFVGYSDLFTLCLNHYAYVDWSILLLLAKEHSLSLPLPVALYNCSMHFQLCLFDGWYARLPCVCLRACADGLWTACEYAVCAGGSIRLYILHILYLLHLLKLCYLSLLL